MPRRTDISSVLVIGSGPIIIGQACEFDYSGTQACRVLRAEGLRVALVNSNPATIMTDPDIADATYVEPITPEFVTKVIERERPDALLPTLGGQTALNTAVALAESGVLERYGVELIGASLPAIHAGEDREAFAKILTTIGAECPRSATAHTVDEALAIGDGLGYPVVVRPSFTLGGGGAGFAHDRTELATRAAAALAASPTHETLVEESVLGWKEYELEVVRDRADNCIVVCAIENLDPMGVHTGDSITVAPVLTLTDPEYQQMRDTAFAVIRAVGVDTGGSNIQFAVDPVTGRQVVIEMNPRVSRSSALASKATGFPIAKIAARLAIGYTLDEITNDVTGTTPASFEPAMDQVVVKVPRFNFDKFPGADDSLGMRMHSVGEVMALGRTFPEALQKALRSMEESGSTLSFTAPDASVEELLTRARRPHPRRLHDVRAALAAGATIAQVSDATGIDPWFVDQICSLNEVADQVRSAPELTADVLRSAKRQGFADTQIAQLRGAAVSEIRHLRWESEVRPVYKTVDTCAAEFAANTPYMYSAYEEETETVTAQRDTIIILGSGPNRIGQGVEFDYACVHAALALGEAGYDTVMINCNPETVSTDYDTSDRLYFEPLTAEDVLEVVHAERASGRLLGVILTLGGQTPLSLAQTLQEEGVPILGTSPASIDAAEDREVFGRLLADCGLVAPEHRTAVTLDGAHAAAEAIGYPVMVRPNYVLGGAGMAIVYDRESLRTHLDDAQVSERNPLLVDRFLDDAIEVDVDAVFDGHELYCGGIMEHIEEAGIHSGDSACALPPISLGRADRQRIREATEVLARALGVRGLLNVQYAIAGGVLHVLEANPRASRSVPFVSKATGVPLAKIAARVMAGQSLAELRSLRLLPDADATHQLASAPVAVKEAVLPWNRFAGVDSVLGPQMRSTGEVMGIDRTFGNAYAKSQEAAYGALPSTGTVFVSVADRDKRSAILPVGRLADLGFTLLATEGTAEVLARHGIESTVVRKHTDGRGERGEPTIVDLLHDGQVDLVVNTPFGVGPRRDGYEIRTAAVSRGIACVTTVQALAACVQAIESRRLGSPDVHSLQDYAEAARQGRSI